MWITQFKAIPVDMQTRDQQHFRVPSLQDMHLINCCRPNTVTTGRRGGGGEEKGKEEKGRREEGHSKQESVHHMF